MKVYQSAAGAWSSLGLSKAEWTETQQIVKAEIATLRDAFGFCGFDRAKPEFYRREISLPSPAAPVPGSNPSLAGRGQVIPFPISAEAARRFEARTPAEKLVLLVVEDHGTLCEMVSLFLMRCGYQVRTASNGVIALEILAREEIHMVLLDLMLPRVDGFAVLRQIHKSRQEMLPYIIVVSAGASDHDRQKSPRSRRQRISAKAVSAGAFARTRTGGGKVSAVTHRGAFALAASRWPIYRPRQNSDAGIGVVDAGHRVALDIKQIIPIIYRP